MPKFRNFISQLLSASQDANIELDWANPITSNLLFHAPLTQESGLIELVSGTMLSITGSSSTLVTTSGSKLSYSNGTYITGKAPSDLDGALPITIMWTQLPTAVSSTGYSAVLDIMPSKNAINSILVLEANNSSYQLAVGIRDGGGANKQATFPVGNITPGIYDTYILILPFGVNTTASQFILYRNNARVANPIFFGAFGNATGLSGIRIAEVLGTTGNNQFIGSISNVTIWQRQLSNSEALLLSAFPWLLYKSNRYNIPIIISAITLVSTANNTDSISASVLINTGVFTNSDETTVGWYGVPDNSNLYSNINEVTRSDSEYIRSPEINGSQGPAIFLLNNSLAAGTWEIDVTAKYSNNSRQIKFTLLDSSNVSVGTTGWVSITSSFADYSPTITSTGIATKIKVEVQ